MVTEISILYVEDDSNSRLVMEVLLKHVMGIKDVMIFPDTHDFLKRFQMLPLLPTLVLLDIYIEPANGFEILKLLRNYPEYDHIKIIALTASVMAHEIEELRTVGFDSLISKPISQTEFPEQLSMILAGYSIWN